MAKNNAKRGPQDLVEKLLKKNQMASLAARLIQQKKPAVICIAGASKSVGTSTLICALARNILEMDSQKSVLIVDAASHNPSQHALWEISQSPGLTEALKIESDVTGCIKHTGIVNIDVLTFGAPKDTTPKLQEIQNFTNVLRRLSYDIVLIDSPPISISQDSIHLSRMASETYLVIRSEESKAMVLKWVAQQYQKNEISISGVIFNQRRNVVPDWLYGML